MKAVIIEDEDNSREFLKNAIQKYVSDVTIIGEASSVKSGIQLINQLQPELIYMDIELPDGVGFTILERITNKNVNVIFTTAFENYALKAYRYSAVDYLLKPLNIDELIEASQRAIKVKENNSYRLAFLQSKLTDSKHTFTEILIDSQERFINVKLDNIMAFEAKSGITTVVLSDGKTLLSNKSLKFYEEFLEDKKFIRIHRSHVINLNQVTKIDKARLGKVTLSNGVEYEFAARKKSLILSLINEQ